MSMKSESIAYFADGHTEAIVDFEISKNGHKIWFTVESGRWFVHQEELVCDEKLYRPEYKFYEVEYSKEQDDGSEFGYAYKVKFLETDEINRIKLRIQGEKNLAY